MQSVPRFGRNLLRAVFCAGVALACTVRPALPQPPNGAPRVGEVGPEIYYLEDDGGRLVPVPGFRYRDFVELFRMQEGLPGAIQPPAAILEALVVRLDLQGDARRGRQTCPITIEATVRQTRGGWVHLPIDLAECFITGSPAHEGPGRLVIDTVPAGADRGYRLWFDAPLPASGDLRHVVTLEGRVGVAIDPDTTTVALRLPPATSSRVVITSADDRAVSVAPDPPPQRITTRDDSGTRATEIVGLAGPVRIRVAGRGAAVARATVPQANVESLVRIDGHNAFTEATLRLENLPADMERIRITLPPRTTLKAARGAATVVARGGTAARPTIDVTCDRDADGKAIIELECERPIEPSAKEPLELLGFAVTDVPPWRQWGRVSLVVEGDWRAEWTDAPRVRRVDPPPAARRPGFVAAFAYDAQPASLPLQVRPRPSRVVIEPDYRYHVAAGRIGMVARLRVSVRGAPVTSLVVEQADAGSAWTIEDVGPATLVDSAAVTVTDGRITIPLLQSLSGEAVVELRGSRRIVRTAEDLAWNLPAPRADLVVPASVSITADSDIEIIPDVARCRGLVRQAAGAPRADTEAETGGLFYRLDAVAGTFVGTRRFLPRRIDASLAITMDVDEDEIACEELVRLTVVHVPLDVVELLVPEEIAASGTLEVRQDDVLLEPLEDRLPVDIGDEPRSAGPRLVRVFPPDPILGPGQLVIRYRLPTPPIRPEATETRLVPLVLPTEARIDRQTLAIDATESLAVDVPDEAWRRDLGPDEQTWAWVAAKRLEGVRLAITTRPRVASGGTIVEAAWLQTHLLADRREDVFTYVLAGAGERLSVTIPAGPTGRSCDFMLDGAPLPVAVTSDGGFAGELPRITSGRRRRFEIRVRSPRAASGWERLATAFRLPAPVRLEPPVFAGRVVQRRFYWEVTARADEHVLRRPALWTSQQRWTWSPTGFSAVPVVSTMALAEWLQQAAGEPATSAAAATELVERRSVYSGVGDPGSHTLWLVPSWCLVLACSGLALAGSLALAYRPRLRRPGVVVPVLAVLVLVAAAAPSLTPLVAQAAIPGAVLGLLAWCLRAVFDRGEPGIDLQPDEVAVSASTLTREISPSRSLVVSPSSVSAERTAGSAGRTAS